VGMSTFSTIDSSRVTTSRYHNLDRRLSAAGVGCLLYLAFFQTVGGGEIGPVRQLPSMLVEAPVVGDARTITTSRQAALTWLRQVTGLRLQGQGVGGQADLQVEGSSFSGAGLSLAGLGLRNPQTEHFHADVPLPWQLFEEPVVSTGLNQVRGGTGHLVGSVELALAPVASGGRLDWGQGGRGHSWQEGLWQETFGESEGIRSFGLGVFGGRETANGFDYSDNSFRRWSGGGQLQLRMSESQADLVFGTQYRDFGARGYYGAPASLPAQETIRDTLVLATWRNGEEGAPIRRASLLYRQFRDLYLLDEERPELYRNRHRSDVLSSAVGGGFGHAEPLSLTWRLEAEDERLDSAYRGTISSTGLGKHDRQRGGGMVLPELRWGRWSFAGGSRFLFFSEDRPAVLPAFGVTYTPAGAHVLSLAYTRGVRLPSYTELAYDSPGSLGDSGLERQESAQWDVAWDGRWEQGGNWRIGAFSRREHNAVDWIKDTPSSRWQAVNLRRLRIMGAGARAEFPVSATLRMAFAYTYLHKRSRSDVFASRYVLDYPEHEIRLTGEWAVTQWCRLIATQSAHLYADNPVRTSDRTGTDGTIAVQFRPPRTPSLLVTASLDNLWDDTFETFPGQPPTERRGSLAVSCTW
jgi:outer membrane receptor protein involved in Fe transport